ncbi:MAG: hypothetical protein WDA03_07270 [Trueperaceae bacterium]|jgi:hypothetical protein
MGSYASFRNRFVSWRVVVAGALLVVLAACSGPAAQGELHGNWEGSWTSDNEGTGSVSAEFTHLGGALSGTVTIGGSPCLVTGTITGEVTGANVAFGAAGPNDEIQFEATLTDDAMQGTYAVESGACAGDTGVFELQKLGLASL